MAEDPPGNKLFGLAGGKLQSLVERMRSGGAPEESGPAPDLLAPAAARVPERLTRFDRFEDFQGLHRMHLMMEKVGVANPYFRRHDGLARDTAVIEGRECLNFATYNYLDLNGHPEVNRAAQAAIERYGTSASASRLTSGDKAVHRELEAAVAALHGTTHSHIFVSGHATNVSTIGQLMGPKDLILHDVLAHNSITQGAVLSGARRMTFPHNDAEALERLLQQHRGRYERVLVVVEGLYSMDGDLPPLPALVELRRRYGFFLMIDEAHSIGVVGETGRGVGEHFGVAPEDVDIWMGTFSKTLAGCGGYVAGNRALIEILRYWAGGSVFSVGMPPAMAAASLAALELMRREPERVQRLRARTQLLLELAREAGLDTGLAQGFGIVPIILGSSSKAVRASNRLFEKGINISPVTSPGVEERLARLRLFVTCAHSEEQLRAVVEAVAASIPWL